ncbi:CAP domain-containing protein [Streptomyces sp. BI20]|uniref:CAP domain-containing protein n=1 Tax=Streptomyces sp. BI20 TaxID=3403460 RepID=UPI003C787DB8
MGRHRNPAPRRPGRAGAVRNGLVVLSAGVVLGTGAVAGGLVPVGDAFPWVGRQPSSAEEARAQASPAPQNAVDGQDGLASLSGRGADPTPSASPSPAAPSASPAPSAPAAKPSPSASTAAPAAPSTSATSAPVTPPKPKSEPRSSATPGAAVANTPAARPSPSASPSAKPSPSSSPSVDTGHSAEEAAVLALVNVERAKVGCRPVRANPPLAALAGAFSKDMKERGFFDHVDPDGRTPWDRADAAGISGLAAENIGRGQGDAASVMAAWMGDPEHRANILDCEFRTLGVGVATGSGGPWWTQLFGF